MRTHCAMLCARAREARGSGPPAQSVYCIGSVDSLCSRSTGRHSLPSRTRAGPCHVATGNSVLQHVVLRSVPRRSKLSSSTARQPQWPAWSFVASIGLALRDACTWHTTYTTYKMPIQHTKVKRTATTWQHKTWHVARANGRNGSFRFAVAHYRSRFSCLWPLDCC